MITAMTPNERAAAYEEPKISFWACQKPDNTDLKL